MATDSPTIENGRLDRAAMALSALCLVHCVATTVFVALLSTAGGLLLDPAIHEIGLVLAILLGTLAFGRGIVAHRRPLPMALGATGLVLMAAALVFPHGHGYGETILTILGVTILASGHLLNRRAHR